MLQLLAAVVLHSSLGSVAAHAYQRPLENYRHTAWASESGLGSVFEVSQSQDGYLWLTTSKGVYRFDGVRFQPLGEATNNLVRDSDIDAVKASRFGGVWLTTRSHGLLLWKDYKLFDFHDRRCTQGRRPDAMVEDADGSLWIAASSGLFHLHQGVCDQVGQDSGYPGGFPAAILLDSHGTLWVKAPTGELLFRRREELRFQQNSFGEAPVLRFAYLHEAPDGSVWLSDSHGLRAVSGPAQPAAATSPKSEISDRYGNFTFDREGALWVATPNGIERFTHPGQTPMGISLNRAASETFTSEDGLTSDNVWDLEVDREGNLWTATYSGIDRFRRDIFSKIRLPASQDFQLAVAAGLDGSVWVGSRSLPLTCIDADGRSRTFRETVQVFSIHRDPHGQIWSSGRADLSSLWRFEGSRLIPVRSPDQEISVPAAMAFDRNGDLWLSTFGPNILHRSGTSWTNENETLGRKPGVIGAMAGDDDGNVWFAFSNKVVEWDGHAYHRYSFPDGELNISVSTLYRRADRLWMGGSGGVTLLRNEQFHKMRWQQDTMPGRVVGLVETPAGDLWINGFSGVVHVPAAEVTHWLQDPNYAVAVEEFNTLDGLPGLAGERFPQPSLVLAPNGRLWFGTTRGVAWLDPAMLDRQRNRLAPPVSIEAIISGDKNYIGSGPVRLPAHTRNLEFDYTALSLSVPERVRLRYRLEDVDKDWQSPSTRRQAFYTNLSPGNYRFRVTAANNDGVWNNEGAFVDFTIAPAFYQMWQFRVLVGLLLLTLLWIIVQMRIASVTSQMQARLAARSEERERIARELHDTLLQSLYGVMLQFHSIADRLLQQDPTRQVLSETLRRAETVMQEGRERVRSLRAPEIDTESLTDTLSTIGYQLQALRPAGFQMQTRGRPRPLKPDIQNEIILIGREALTNAFMHAQAQLISVDVAFRPFRFVVEVQDNGCGIEEAVLKAWGREGHWGLRGMRERAEKLGGHLEIISGTLSGTRVRLTVPGGIAYAGKHDWFRNPFRALRRGR